VIACASRRGERAETDGTLTRTVNGCKVRLAAVGAYASEIPDIIERLSCGIVLANIVGLDTISSHPRKSMRTQVTRVYRRLGTVFAFVCAFHVETASAQTVKYTVQDLDLGQIGGYGSMAAAINDAGVVVGWMVNNVDDSRAARTGAAGIFELLPGLESLSSYAEAINHFGDIAGAVQVSAYPNGSYHAIRYTRTGGIEDLGTLGGGPSSFGTGINSAGQVAGWSDTSLTPFVIRAFLSKSGQPLQDLGTFTGGTSASSVASGINDAGQVAGHSETLFGQWHAFRYTPGSGLQDLGTSVYDNSFATAINATGQIVGHVSSPTGEHAFRYSDGSGMQDLHTFGTTSAAFGLNDHGDVVGYFYSSTQPPTAFLYTDAEGMVDLNSRIDPASGWVLNVAYGINAAGEIVGVGTPTGQREARAVKLTPIPPDTTPPTIVSASSNPAFLWPPSGMMLDVQLSVSATDNVDPAPRCSITGVSSSEPTNDGDMVVTGSLSLRLRAERDGTGPGRVYSVNVTCSDTAANQARTVVPVRVPHDLAQPD
jgi:probable HAF family extracellular repeat protein